MRALTVVLVAGLAAGCGDSDQQVDFGREDLGPDLHAVLSREGTVKMALTRQWVYFALSDSARVAADAEFDREAEESFFGGILRGVIGQALGFRAKYAVAEIRDIRWEDGRMRVEFNDPDRRVDDGLQLGEGEAVTEAFTEEAVTEFSEAFRSLKSVELPPVP